MQLLKSYDKPMVLFSGDVFAPSLMSTVTKGKHMVPFLNMMSIKAACIGNHDFDFGARSSTHMCFLSCRSDGWQQLSQQRDWHGDCAPACGPRLCPRVCGWGVGAASC